MSPCDARGRVRRRSGRSLSPSSLSRPHRRCESGSRRAATGRASTTCCAIVDEVDPQPCDSSSPSSSSSDNSTTLPVPSSSAAAPPPRKWIHPAGAAHSSSRSSSHTGSSQSGEGSTTGRPERSLKRRRAPPPDRRTATGDHIATGGGHDEREVESGRDRGGPNRGANTAVPVDSLPIANLCCSGRRSRSDRPQCRDAHSRSVGVNQHPHIAVTSQV
jgi:hypothetical protein